MGPCRNRRDFLRIAGASLLAPLVEAPLRAAPSNPSLPVSIARCREYEPGAVSSQLQTMMDQLGGLTKLVAGKTVAVKVNLTGDVHQPALGLPGGRTYHVHPNVVMATAAVLDRAGAKRIRFLEGTYQLGAVRAVPPRRRLGHERSRRPEGDRRIRRYAQPRQGKEVPRGEGTMGRQPVPCLPPEPFLRRLRRLRLAGQAQEPRDGGRDDGDQEQFRDHAAGPLFAPPAQRASHVGPRGRVSHRPTAAGGWTAAGGRPEITASADLPCPAPYRRLDRHPTDRPDDHRWDRDGLRRRGAVAEPGLAEARPAAGGPQPGLHRRRSAPP